MVILFEKIEREIEREKNKKQFFFLAEAFYAEGKEDAAETGDAIAPIGSGGEQVFFLEGCNDVVVIHVPQFRMFAQEFGTELAIQFRGTAAWHGGEF